MYSQPHYLQCSYNTEHIVNIDIKVVKYRKAKCNSKTEEIFIFKSSNIGRSILLLKKSLGKNKWSLVDRQAPAAVIVTFQFISAHRLPVYDIQSALTHSICATGGLSTMLLLKFLSINPKGWHKTIVHMLANVSVTACQAQPKKNDINIIDKNNHLSTDSSFYCALRYKPTWIRHNGMAPC